MARRYKTIKTEKKEKRNILKKIIRAIKLD